ncbi:MAG: hypothetical protein COA78_25785 [Blastopirellula sp.]|nr:MAG: hypothetical protein COA78_25785 [Blastopirellula sp.]
MVFLRYLLVVGLSACVCFTGYSVYKSFQTEDRDADYLADFDTYDDAPPLFDASVPETPSTDLAATAPNISFPTPSDTNEAPKNPAISEFDQASVFTTGTPIVAENVDTEGSDTPAINFGLDQDGNPTEDLDLSFAQNSYGSPIPTIGGFGYGYTKTHSETFEDSNSLEKQFKLAEALNLLSNYSQGGQLLTVEESEQLYEKMDELASKVMFASNKHLALPAKTFLPNDTLESIAKDHSISIAFLKAINQFDDENLPTPGDSVKVIEGPLNVKFDTKNNEAILYANMMFVKRFALDSANLDQSLESIYILKRETKSEKIRYVLKDQLALSSTMSKKSDQPQLIFSPEALKEFATLVGDQINGHLIIREEEKVVETTPEPKTTPTEIEVTAKPEEPTKKPVDSLQMEVFSPSKSVPLGQMVLYGIRVTNLSDKAVADVNVIAFFSKGLEPKVLEGSAGKISVGQAAFDSIQLAPNESIELTIQAESTKTGEFVFRPEVESKTLASKFVSELFLKVKAAAAPTPETADTSPSIFR